MEEKTKSQDGKEPAKSKVSLKSYRPGLGKLESSRVITFIFTMETSTSDEISLETGLFLSKCTIL